jgi:hypothetical protein
MSAFFCALGAMVFYFAVSYMFSKYETSKTGEKQKKSAVKKDEKQKTLPFKTDFVIIYIIPAVTALLLAYSRTLWANANSVEVYPIHIFFLPLLIFLFLKAVEAKTESDPDVPFIMQNKYYLLFALALGLSFTNHLTTILLPCLQRCSFCKLQRQRRMWMLPLTWFALIGFCYIYLPVCANMEPESVEILLISKGSDGILPVNSFQLDIQRKGQLLLSCCRWAQLLGHVHNIKQEQ